MRKGARPFQAGKFPIDYLYASLRTHTLSGVWDMKETDKHIELLRLFDAARGGDFELTEDEQKHLLECEECKSVLAVFARQFGRPRDNGNAA